MEIPAVPARKFLCKPSPQSAVLSIRNGALSADRVHLRVSDYQQIPQQSNSTGVRLDSSLHDTPTKASDAIRAPQVTQSTRIISIYSERTIEPLSVTRELLSEIFTEYNIDPDFAEIIDAFGSAPRVFEGSNHSFRSRYTGSDTCGEQRLFYLLRYVEENKRGGIRRWSTRHMGVYHARRHDRNFFLLLHCVEDPTIELRLMSLYDGHSLHLQQLKSFVNSPAIIHRFIIEAFSRNWRLYIEERGEQVDRENDRALTARPHEVDASSTFSRVQRLRHLMDQVLSIRAFCFGNLQLTNKLLVSNSDLGLDDEASRLSELVESTDALQSRIRNVIDFVGYTLTLHNQEEGVKVNKQLKEVTEEMRIATTQLKDLTQETVDDSATVKIITFVSAFYIPGSFVGTMFGMNFFVFDEMSRTISISKDFWIFVISWVPLTLITAGIYLLIMFYAGRRKRSSSGNWTKDSKNEFGMP